METTGFSATRDLCGSVIFYGISVADPVFFVLLDPDPLVRGSDSDPAPDPSIKKQKL